MLARFTLTLGLVSVLALGGAAKALGQEGGPPGAVEQDTTRQDTTAQDTLPPPRPPFRYVPAAFSLTLSVGRPGSGPLQTQPVLVQHTAFYGSAPDSVRLARDLRSQGGLFAAVTATMSLGPAWALNLAVGVARAEVQTSYQGDDDFGVSAAALTGRGGDLTTLGVESTIRYRIPSTRRLQPFLELGGAVSRWSLDRDLSVSAGLSSGVTRFEAVAGVGAVVPLNDRFSARFRASSHVLRTPVSPQEPGETLVSVPKSAGPTLFRRRHSLVMQTGVIPDNGFADSARELLALLRVEVGVSLDLGRVAQASSGPTEPSAPTSPPGR